MIRQLGHNPADARAQALNRAFMPAAMELESTPAHPLGRAILWSIVSLFLLAVTWASLGRVDVIVVADGVILPSGRVRPVQPAIAGVVTDIHVAEGQHVQSGQVLLSLDTTVSAADVQRLALQLQGLKSEQAHLRGVSAVLRVMLDAGVAGGAGAVRNAALDNPEPALASRIAALQSMDAVFTEQRQAREQALYHALASVARLQGLLPLLEERAAALATLHQRGLAPRMQWLELEQERIDADGQLLAERHRTAQLRAELEELRQRREQWLAEALMDATLELVRLDVEVGALRQEWVKAREIERQQRIRAPSAGVVHALRVHTPGTVVQAGGTLLEIVPEDDELVVEAWVPNRDIGFVREGQAASLKVQTFQFTRYGTVPGRVTLLSRDAVVDEVAGPRYLARIHLERDWMLVDGVEVRFSPGMIASAEIATGRRRLIEFFLAPVVAALQEAGRER